MFNAIHDKAGKRLIVTADNESRADLADAYRRGGYYYAEGEIAEGLRDLYEPRGADDTPDAWLSDAPYMIDCDGIAYADNGETPVYIGTPIFAFPDYCTIDPWARLKNTGRVEFVEMDWNDVAEIHAYTRPEVESYFTGGANEGLAVHVDPVTFRDIGGHDIAANWPEFARQSEPDRFDPGLYFWRDGRRFGPYSTSPRGILNAERDGMRFPSRDEARAAA